MVGGLLETSVRSAAIYWAALAILYVIWIIGEYYSADNHHYLTTYWLVGLAGCYMLNEAQRPAALALTARALIGGCFLLAVATKLANQRYRDGSVFVDYCLTDPRFRLISTFVGGAAAGIQKRHADAIERLRVGISSSEVVPVSGELRFVAAMLTWWTVSIEIAVALAILWPSGTWVMAWQLVPLLAFTAMTFTMIPVAGFGRIILVMVMAAVEGQGWRVMLLVFLLILPLFPSASSFLQDVLSRRLIRRKRLLGAPEGMGDRLEQQSR